MKIVEIKNNFKEEVLDIEGKVLVDFYANWCGPCKMLRPVLEEFANETNIKVVSVDVDSEPDLAQSYGVMSIPCLVVFENGQEKNRSVGFIPKEEIENLIGK